MAANRNSDSSRYSNSNNKEINLSLIEANLSNSVISEEECDNVNNGKEIFEEVSTNREYEEPPLVNFSLHNPSNSGQKMWLQRHEGGLEIEKNSRNRASIQQNSAGNASAASSIAGGNIVQSIKSSSFIVNPMRCHEVNQQQKSGRSSSNQKERALASLSRNNFCGDLVQNPNQTESFSSTRENYGKMQEAKKIDLKLDLSFLNKSAQGQQAQSNAQKNRSKKEQIESSNLSAVNSLHPFPKGDENSKDYAGGHQTLNNNINKSPMSKLEKKIAEALMNRDQTSTVKPFTAAEEQFIFKRDKSPIEGMSARRLNEDLDCVRLNQNMVKKRNKELAEECAELRKKLSSAERELEKFKTMKEEVLRLREQNEDLNKKIGKIEEKWVSKKVEIEEITRINQEQYDLLFHFITSNFDPKLDANDMITYIAEKFLEVLNDEPSNESNELYWKEIALDYMKKCEILQMNICDLESRVHFSMTDKINSLHQQLQVANFNYEQLLGKYQKQSSFVKYNYPQNRISQQHASTRKSKEALTDRQYGADRVSSNKKRDTDWESHSTERESIYEVNEANQSYGQMIRATRKNMNIREQNFSFFSQSPITSRVNNENDPNVANKKKPPKATNIEETNDYHFQSGEEGKQNKKIKVVVDKKVGKYIEKLKQRLRLMENELSFFREKSVTDREYLGGDSVEFDTSRNIDFSKTNKTVSSRNQSTFSLVDSSERINSYHNNAPTAYNNFGVENLKTKSFR